MNNILKKRILADDMKELVVESPQIAKVRKAGQFVIVRANETGERIPLTIADADAEAGTITLIFQEVGKSTMLLGCFEEGDSILDVVGPLGKPTHIENFGTVVCMGGGAGIAPLHPIAKALKEAGNRVISIIGARTEDLLIMQKRMKEASTELLISTDDGSFGVHGFVTDILQSLIDKGEKINLCFAIGPIPMMAAACRLKKKYDLHTVVSLNPIMVDGTGMCGACRVTVGGKTKFVCVDGPDFDGHEVDFTEMVKRSRAYLPQERESKDRFIHEGGCCHK